MHLKLSNKPLGYCLFENLYILTFWKTFSLFMNKESTKNLQFFKKSFFSLPECETLKQESTSLLANHCVSYLLQQQQQQQQMRRTSERWIAHPNKILAANEEEVLYLKLSFEALMYLQPTYLPGKTSLSHSVWPDWAIYWTLGNLFKPLATIKLFKSPTF